MHRAADPVRDQSYFLFTTTREQLSYLRFPLGHLKTKAETRSMAEEFGLSVADKPDSQDICFVPSGNYAAVIEKLRPGAAEPGDIVDLNGEVLGRHEGVIHYTIGQRRGLGLGGGDPLYVIRLDADAGRVVVGPRAALATRRIPVAQINWIGDSPFDAPPKGGWETMVKIRSTRPPVAARIHPRADGGAEVELLSPEEGVAPGQACVFYAPEGSRVLGGGWIGRR
jgi:tRNA-specific 2-thiouridylase